MKDIILLLAIFLNITCAANDFGLYLNLPFAFHCTVIIISIKQYYKINITLNNNFIK